MSDYESVKFSLDLESGNAAMVDQPSARVGAVPTDVATKVICGLDHGIIQDANGNTVGEWFLDVTESEEEEDNHA